jgi:hypothetical protein
VPCPMIAYLQACHAVLTHLEYDRYGNPYALLFRLEGTAHYLASQHSLLRNTSPLLHVSHHKSVRSAKNSCLLCARVRNKLVVQSHFWTVLCCNENMEHDNTFVQICGAGHYVVNSPFHPQACTLLTSASFLFELAVHLFRRFGMFQCAMP